MNEKNVSIPESLFDELITPNKEMILLTQLNEREIERLKTYNFNLHNENKKLLELLELKFKTSAFYDYISNGYSSEKAGELSQEDWQQFKQQNNL